MLDEMDMVRDLEPPRYISASGYQMATGYYYHMGHSWSRFEHGGRIRVGVDDFLVKVFGSASSLNLPPLGEKMQQNKVGWAFARSGRHRSRGHQRCVWGFSGDRLGCSGENVFEDRDKVLYKR